MSEQFPHLSDNIKFPGIANVDPYRIQQSFDYTRWEPGTKLKLCNVNWCGDYENVVKFDDDAARDRYFDALESPIHVLESGMRVFPKQSIKLPVPFDELVNFNYLMVEFAQAPVPFANEHARRFFYFMRDVEFAAANTTSCVLDLDVWTTYVNRIDINYMMLERGHAPLAASNIDDYLKNPIENNKYLLAEDVSYGEPAAVKHSDFVPFGNGTKYILFATTIPYAGLYDLGSVNAISLANPGFYSTGDRAGADAGISSAAIAAGGTDYSKLKLQTTPTTSNSNFTPNGIWVFAVAARDFYVFMQAMVEQAPQILETIQSIFMVDESMIVLGTEGRLFKKDSMTWKQLANTGLSWNDLANSGHTYEQIDKYAFLYFGSGSNGFAFWKVTPNSGLLKQLNFSKDDFGYPAEYAELAKLYTFPYAALEVSDSTGATSVIKIEDCDALKIQKKVSLAYPYIRFEAFLTGVGGGDPNEFVWKDLSDREFQESIPGSDFRDFNFGFDIPKYAIYQHGYDKFKLHNYNTNNVKALTEKELAYTNDVRSTNTSYQNELDAINKTFTNTDASATVTKTNAQRSALAAYQNALSSNATGQANTNASNATSYANSVNSANTGLTNTNASNATSYGNSVNSANVGLTNTQNSNATNYANSVNSANVNLTNTQESSKTQVEVTTLRNTLRTTQVLAQNSLNDAVTVKNNKASSDVTDNSTSLTSDLTGIDNEVLDSQYWGSILPEGLRVASAAAAPIFTGLSAAVSGAAVEAIPMKMATASISGMQSTTQNMLAFGSDPAAMAIMKSVNTRKMKRNNSASVAATKIATTLATDVNNLSTDTAVTMATTQNSNDSTVTVKNTTTSNANAKRSRDTSVANSAATRNTSNDNAQRSRDTTVSNSAATRDTSNANAKRSRDTTVSNSASTRDTSNANAQRSRDTSDLNAARSYSAAISNSENSAALTRANAYRDRNLARANAKYSRDQSVENAQRTLTTGLELVRQSYLDRRLDPPIKIGEYSGDPLPDEFAWRGVQFKIKTQKPGEIAPAGDFMLRFGYALNQMWNFNGFNVMKHFSYWKCSDLWLTGGDGVIESAQELIKSILKSGVTIWSNPDEIGHISIYDNLEENA